MFPTQNAVVSGVVLPVSIVTNSNQTLGWEFAAKPGSEWARLSEVRCACGHKAWDCCDLEAQWGNGAKPEAFRFALRCRVSGARHELAAA